MRTKNCRKTTLAPGMFALLLVCLSFTGCGNSPDQHSGAINLPSQKEEGAVFEVVDPNYELSPHTGMTRKHWEDAGLYLLDGAFSYIDDLDDPMLFPKLPGKSYPHDESGVPTAKLEGLCRTLFVAAPLLKENPDLELNGINVGDYYRHQILQLLNPESPSYINHRDGGPSQKLVEFGALAISLFVVPDVIWEPLTQSEKDELAAVMLSYGDGPTIPSNWKFFNIFVLSFFDSQGYDVNESLLEEYLQQSLEDYRGQGWYNDNPAYDFYSMWAYQMYGMLWSEYYGNENYPEYATQFRENFKDLDGNYAYMFGEDGEMIMWGRSVSYRMGSIVPFPLMGWLDDPSINYGWMRRISSGTLLQFLQHPEFLEDNVPTLGFYGHFEPAVQQYSARASSYWMGKAFLGLLVPEDNAFWQSVENEGPWEDEFEEDEVYNNFQEASNILITDYPAIGAAEVRAWCHATKADDWQNFRSGENYNRLSYNSAFPWQADGENGEVSMNYVFQNENDEWEPFRLYTFQKFEDGIYYRDAVLETNENIKFQLADMPMPNGILRIDKNVSTDPIDFRLGHYSLPQLEDDIREEVRKIEGTEVSIIDNGEYQLALIPLQGWDDVEILQTRGLHPVDEISKIINASRSFSLDEQEQMLQATLMLWKKSGEDWTDEELTPVSEIEVGANGEILVSMKNGQSVTVDFK